MSLRALVGGDGRLPGIVAVILVAGLTALAWANRFIQDDAFITFRYARNVLEGLGPVWNAGERVEGYSNFLWMLLAAGAMGAGADPPAFTHALGLASFACSLAIVRRLAVECGLGGTAALVAVLLAGTNYTFSAWATGGLETSLVSAVFLAGCLVTVRILVGGIARERGLALLSLLCSIGILLRMDTLVLFAGLLLAVVVTGEKHRHWGDLLRLSLFPAILLLPWLAWKLWFYGDLFPQPFYLKAVGASSPERALRYFYAFVESYCLAPFLFLSIFLFGAVLRKENRVWLLFSAIVLLWLLYLLKVGGDFMEFRFMVPVIPVMMLLLSWMMFSGARRAWVRAAGVLLVLAGSVHHAATFRYDPDVGVEPVRALDGHLHNPWENWAGIGKALREVFRPDDGVVIATTAAGAIPYYSGLTAVDMLGLNTPGALARGVHVGFIPGHQRVLPYEFLDERGVHLVISHPNVRRMGDSPAQLPLLPAADPMHIRGMAVWMPVGRGYQVEMLYIRRHPAVDSAIAARGWVAGSPEF